MVIGVYAAIAHSGLMESLIPDPSCTYYNLLVQGFRDGHLSLRKDVPPELGRLSDPYDPSANAVYRTQPDGAHDLSYYRGRFYLYFGVTPVFLLFWPLSALTGDFLFSRQAATIFCSLGFLAAVGLLRSVWQRYFAEVNAGVVAACALALGLASGIPLLLSESEIYQVAISCGYMLGMLGLVGIWRALHSMETGWRWVAMASLAYGLAVGARPSLLFCAVVLLVPVIQARCERRRIRVLLLAAIIPIGIVGVGLLLYNALRFDDLFEFGQRYQLAANRPNTMQYFSPRYLWFNLRVYFFESVEWSRTFPFAQSMTAVPAPSGHGGMEGGFGILTNVPLVWLALAAPLACRGQLSSSGRGLRWFVTAVGLQFWICVLTVGAFWWASFRYVVDFLPALVMLSGIGILWLEGGLIRSSEPKRAWRLVMRAGWGLLLAFSVAVNLFVALSHRAEMHHRLGQVLTRGGRLTEAIAEIEVALRLRPGYAEAHRDLAIALQASGHVPAALDHYERAHQLNPADLVVQNNLAWLLAIRIPTEAGNPRRALELARGVCQKDGYQTISYLDTLAVAHAANAQFEQAISIALRALARARLSGQSRLTGQIEERLELYQAGRAYQESVGETGRSKP